LADSDGTKFRQLIVPHFDAAYNLARWLTGNDADASDVLQDSSIKAFRFIADLNSENPRGWFFQIVRNTSYTMLKNKKAFIEIELEKDIADPSPNAEDTMAKGATAKELHQALDELSVPYREILILRELEEASYEEIAEILQVPLGTVMSRLARARDQLRKKLSLKGGRT
jgi:RNA polymerase sigma-70 factor (ECF subfamily)